MSGEISCLGLLIPFHSTSSDSTQYALHPTNWQAANICSYCSGKLSRCLHDLIRWEPATANSPALNHSEHPTFVTVHVCSRVSGITICLFHCVHDISSSLSSRQVCHPLAPEPIKISSLTKPLSHFPSCFWHTADPGCASCSSLPRRCMPAERRRFNIHQKELQGLLPVVMCTDPRCAICVCALCVCVILYSGERFIS